MVWAHQCQAEPDIRERATSEHATQGGEQATQPHLEAGDEGERELGTLPVVGNHRRNLRLLRRRAASGRVPRG